MTMCLFSTILFFTFFINDKCNCIKTNKVISSANMIIEYRPQKLNKLAGSITDGTGTIFDDSLVEVYRKKKGIDAYHSTEVINPLITCKTDNEGKFCINNLSPGKYVLKAGTTDGGFNAVYIIVTVNRFKLFHKNKSLDITLTVGQ